jgi:hypothetical protein
LALTPAQFVPRARVAIAVCHKTSYQVIRLGCGDINRGQCNHLTN